MQTRNIDTFLDGVMSEKNLKMTEEALKNALGRKPQTKDIEKILNGLVGAENMNDIRIVIERMLKQNPQENEDELKKRLRIRKIIERDMPESSRFTNVICESLLAYQPVDYFGTISMMFGYIWREQLKLNQPFGGFPLNTFFEILLTAFPKLEKRKDVLTTVTLMLEDVGYAREEIYQGDSFMAEISFPGMDATKTDAAKMEAAKNKNTADAIRTRLLVR